MNKVSEIIGCITDIAPLKWQESWDNAGLLVGDANMLIDKALVTLDVTEAVIDEAIEKGFHLVISHHPVIYRPLKHLLPENTIERTIMKAIKNNATGTNTATSTNVVPMTAPCTSSMATCVASFGGR